MHNDIYEQYGASRGFCATSGLFVLCFDVIELFIRRNRRNSLLADQHLQQSLFSFVSRCIL